MKMYLLNGMRLLICSFLAMVWMTGISLAADSLKMVTIEAKSGAAVKALARMGIDIAAVRKGPLTEGPRGLRLPTYQIEAVISALDQKKLKDYEWNWSDLQLKGARQLSGQTYKIYHSFDEPNTGIKAQLLKIQAKHRLIARLKKIGHTIQNRPILAMRLGTRRPKKPQVLFLATHHAREWVAAEMAMRLIRYLVNNYGKDNTVSNLLNSVEIWVIPVANPDGYEYTFTTERLWRKNLRDNDDDGEITIADGVDLNRNFDSHWGLDQEGSSEIPSDMTFRGAAPNSEPETRAMIRFIKHQNFKFIVSYHTYGNLILYPWGWQVKTPSLDDPIFVAQAGTDENPAIIDSLLGSGYNPGVGADLYITNGDFTDWTYDVAGIPSYTVELTDEYGFEFPDDDDMLETVFEDNLPFALAVAESAKDPAHPVSPAGIAVEDVYHTPLVNSYGSDQIVELIAPINAQLTLQYNINDQADQTVGFSEQLGRRYNQTPGVYFSRYVATIPGQQAGDTVTYKINSGDKTIGPFTYSVIQTNDSPVLILAADSNYLDYYTHSLSNVGLDYDVWDAPVQAAAPDYAGVLSHYKVVTWYSGDEFAPNIDEDYSIFEDEVLAIRNFINYHDGKLLATGQDLAWLASVYGMFSNDFFQYYLGGYLHVEGGGMEPDTERPFDVTGEPGDPIFDGLAFRLHDGNGADNQQHADTFLDTGFFEPAYDTHIAARYVRPDRPYDPHSGDYYVYSQMADMAYKRLGGTFSIPADDPNPTLTFWISYDIEPDWDYAFVEIAPAGSDDWTTLADLGGLTTADTGESCPEGWAENLHPQLAHYMDSACQSMGATGEWNAFSGNSGGWRQVTMDLSAYAGQTVELYISYVSDWGTQNLGVFIDDITLSGQPLQDFETDQGAWEITTTPDNSPYNNWELMTSAGLPEGPAIRTDDSVYLGFGFEAIDTEETRDLLMQRIMNYLGQ